MRGIWKGRRGGRGNRKNNRRTTCDHNLAPLSEPCEDILHLGRCRVLHLVCDYPGLLEGPAAHEAERDHLHCPLRPQVLQGPRPPHLCQAVDDGLQVRGQLGVGVTRQEADVLPRSHRGPRDDDLLDVARVELLDPGLAGKRRLPCSRGARSNQDRRARLVAREGVGVGPLGSRAREDLPGAAVPGLGEDVPEGVLLLLQRRPARLVLVGCKGLSDGRAGGAIALVAGACALRVRIVPSRVVAACWGT